MCEHQNNNSGLITGLAIGAAIGAGMTFLFGTKKGKQIRERIREEYPELFNQIEDTVENLEENLSDKYGEVIDEVSRVKKELSDMTLREASKKTKTIVTGKVDKIGKAVESFGKQLNKASAGKVRRFIKSGRKL